VYTGTHDNDTTIGWYERLQNMNAISSGGTAKRTEAKIHWDLMKLALQSVADIAVIPFQDVLGLGSEGRMNFPGTVDGNWEWRFTWEQLDPWITKPAI